MAARVALVLSGSPVSGSYDFEATFIGEGEADVLPETDNPSILFTEPDEVEVELRLGSSIGPPKGACPMKLGREVSRHNELDNWRNTHRFESVMATKWLLLTISETEPGLWDRLKDTYLIGQESVSLNLTPNPPKDTDGRGEGSGRGWVRELQGRWPGVLG